MARSPSLAGCSIETVNFHLCTRGRLASTGSVKILLRVQVLSPWLNNWENQQLPTLNWLWLRKHTASHLPAWQPA